MDDDEIKDWISKDPHLNRMWKESSCTLEEFIDENREELVRQIHAGKRALAGPE
jgi:hypothetical protein